MCQSISALESCPRPTTIIQTSPSPSVGTSEQGTRTITLQQDWAWALRQARIWELLPPAVGYLLREASLRRLLSCPSWRFALRLPERGERLPPPHERCNHPLCVACRALEGYAQAGRVKDFLLRLLPRLTGPDQGCVDLAHAVLALPPWAVPRALLASDAALTEWEQSQTALRRAGCDAARPHARLSVRALRRLGTDVLQQWCALELGLPKATLVGMYAVFAPLAGDASYYPHLHVLLVGPVLQDGHLAPLPVAGLCSPAAVARLQARWRRALVRALEPPQSVAKQRPSVACVQLPALEVGPIGAPVLTRRLRRVLNYMHRPPLHGALRLVAAGSAARVAWRGAGRWCAALTSHRKLPRLRAWAGTLADRVRGRTLAQLRITQQGRASRDRARAWATISSHCARAAGASRPSPSRKEHKHLATTLQSALHARLRSLRWLEVMGATASASGLPHQDADPRWSWNPTLPGATLLRRRLRSQAERSIQRESQRGEAPRLLLWYFTDHIHTRPPPAWTRLTRSLEARPPQPPRPPPPTDLLRWGRKT